MRTFRVSDQMYEQLKSFIVDPFDDTPEVVLGRLIEIVNKAKGRWASFEAPESAPEAEAPAKPRRKEPEGHNKEPESHKDSEFRKESEFRKVRETRKEPEAHEDEESIIVL